MTNALVTFVTGLMAALTAWPILDENIERWDGWALVACAVILLIVGVVQAIPKKLNVVIPMFQASTNAFASFLRVTCEPFKRDAKLTVKIRDGSDNAELGNVEFPLTQATIQISAAQLELRANPPIVPKSGARYKLLIKGNFRGAVEHVHFSSQTGQISPGKVIDG